MTVSSTNPIPFAISRQFPALGSWSSVFLGNNGGFSGAKLWRISCREGAYCLRAWPADRTDSQRLQTIHALMNHARGSGLIVIPEIHLFSNGKTFLYQDHRYWELTCWMSGRASYKDEPTANKLREAFQTLAWLHRCWKPRVANSGPCPAISRRQACLHSWQAHVRSGWQPSFGYSASRWIGPVAERAWRLLSEWIPQIDGLCFPWNNTPLPLQMCLCDIWHDHLLFEGDRLTGLIDFGSVKLDHVSVDLARLLGSLVEDQTEMKVLALEAYSSIRPVSREEHALIDVLDRTGTVLAMANWLTWIYRDKRPFDDCSAVAARLSQLINRVERWS
jgi:homoserine kinase type II